MEKLLQDYLHGEGTLEGVREPADFDRLCEEVRKDAAGRLRWQVVRRLGLSPFLSSPGRDEYLYALAQLRLDREEALERLCPTCQARAKSERCACCGAALPIQNPGFNETRYEELKQHGASSL